MSQSATTGLHNSREAQTALLPESMRWRAIAEGLGDIMAFVNARKSLAEVLSFVVAKATEVFGSDAAAIYRRQSETGTFRLETLQGEGSVPVQQVVPGQERLGFAGAESGAIVVADLRSELEHRNPQVPYTAQDKALEQLARHYRAIIAVPVSLRDEAFGALVLYWRAARAFDPREGKDAAAFAALLSPAIENVRLLDEVQEEALVDERRRLAARVHDSVTQSLYSLALHAHVAYERTEAGDLEGASALCQQVGEIAWDTLKETRLLLFEMQPPVLEREGLVSALRRRLAVVEERSGITGRVLMQGAFELPKHQEEALYWIAQEALNNALKHAAASSVTVRLRVDDQLVELAIEDNGRGFDPELAAGDAGLGLDTMRQRVEALGGSLSITSAPGQGTTVRARITPSGS